MPWWGWLILGIGLLGVEMFVIDAQFYLVFLGVAAALVGLVGLAGVALPEWAQWLLFAALAIVTMLAFRKRVYAMVRGKGAQVQAPVTTGDRVLVPSRLEPGQSCRVDYRGSTWTARNVDGQAIEAGSEALISHVDGLTLHVKAATVSS
jgi:membrane protein implicated in regulation of membrane protease activity